MTDPESILLTDDLDESLRERLMHIDSVSDSVTSLAPSPWPQEMTPFFDPNGAIKNIPEFLHESFGIFTLRLYNLQPDFLYSKISLVSVGEVLITVKNETFYGAEFSRIRREMVANLSNLYARAAAENVRIRRRLV